MAEIKCVDCGTVMAERWVFRRGGWRCEACDKKLDPVKPASPKFVVK